ncbi:pyruvate:ferredoxin (flavodoxin) oxidoreductase [Rhodobacter capsulatus]|uniref:pyruvate:ferredoxin (flavodoxin) oxidoreductase n=1 Tax=Rhodobacter capsulatus TaxID=1061 RepID=UPI0003D32D09|nr:pyruvate:ferredoxin (flavodoxin) oxidoreductase [Rhodobacter capsulatus]ETD01510.1 pyruvate-flavodoxin oxidoreductase [Rhodobacter capsulatus DE442]ETD76577.1 pyruvate-flavodoxin oxidoreductase [Rhodobacter capsulatus R121]ETE53414.1 pyruvate-flavodoxin oxidoreductase [Rhodobacter capsulatus Y262]MDS0927184.1 pyruvate:ferredoxin (flavodoxin) oxidoreductase [Rhodobacter capsulatus]
MRDSLAETPKAATETGLRAVMDGNTAAAHVAYRVNEVCGIYPITPSSTMAELADEWAARGVTNIWGNVPVIQEMQSEAGAAGAVHGALQAGAMTTTFTASQGLMLMIPNMFKIAGELTPTVFHVAARALATHALSIFGDHSDVMAVRSTGFAMLASASVQEAHDMALIAQAATLRARVPFVHFFDGFRTSHEVNTLRLIPDDTIRAMIDDDLVRAHRARALSPDNPVVRGTAQNPDVFFQGREAGNPFHAAVPAIVAAEMARLGALTGRRYGLVDYLGDPEAERVIVIMGSSAEVVEEALTALNARGAKLGALIVRLYRPFPAAAFLAALPATCTKLAVLDRCKEPGAPGEPLFLDVVATLCEAVATGTRATLPRITGGRYGLSSKDFDPAQVKAVYDELAKDAPKQGFTVGITDDVSFTSLSVDPDFHTEPEDVVRAVFFGLGADGTVGANKNSVKILAEEAGLSAQGYFVYDSHKSGAQTVSHLRFGPRPIKAPYLIHQANFVACHQFPFLSKIDILRVAAPGATVLLNAPFGPDRIWDRLPRSAQQTILTKGLKLYVIDANKAAREVGLGRRTNTILQTCFFALSGVLPREEAIAQIKAAIKKTYGRKGKRVIEQNWAAVDGALERLHEVKVPGAVTSGFERPPAVPPTAPEFVRRVTALMMEDRGDEIPVSLLPADGTFPTGTAAWEKRNVADEVPAWRSDLCIQCGQCSFVCPHSVIRAKYFDEDLLEGAPEVFKSAPVNARGYPGARFSLQFHVEDCTGCGLCIEACPAQSPVEPGVKALNLTDKAGLLEEARQAMGFFAHLPVNDRARVDFANVRGVQFLEPLFEFSGACAGCGETPYVKLLSQLFGDRLMIANATGCSSIYSGNLPVTPWTKNCEGRGPAWANSLFEDNAEFGLGFRLAADKHLDLARNLAADMAPEVGEDLVAAILSAPQIRESEIRAQRERVATLKTRLLAHRDAPRAQHLMSVIDHLVRRSIWIVGGDGWAYDIGYGGLDHVLASGRNVNILVMDTEVYSNTGGQASKATPLGAIAKFAAAGKRTARKDLALQAVAYGNVYVAQVAMGANPQQTLQAFREAEAYDGPSLILAYSHCIAHGFDIRRGLDQQDRAVASGYWPLLRYDPQLRGTGEAPFRLDSPRPTLPFKDYAYNELRYSALAATRPEEAAALLNDAQQAVLEKYRSYEDFARMDAGPDPARALGAAGKM